MCPISAGVFPISSSKHSVIIVGGGVIGLFSALELHRAGLQVTVIDRQTCGRESSWAGGGIISPLYPWRYPDAVTRLAQLSQQIYPELLGGMQQQTGIDPEFLPSGMLILGDYDHEKPEPWSRRFDVEMHAVDSNKIRVLAPEVSSDLEQGWWLPAVHQVRNPRLVNLLKAYLINSGITLVENEAVKEILTDHGTAIGVRTHTATYQADSTLIAGGAWTAQILETTGVKLDIKPIKGQMLLFHGPAQTIRHITLSEDRYIIPRLDGRVLVGSTTEETGFDKSTSTEVRELLQDYAQRTIPAIKQFNLEMHWSGLRPGSKQGIPSIGKHPFLSNLFINSGHYRNGLVMAPASARLVCEIMLEKPTSLAQSDYAPCDKLHT